MRGTVPVESGDGQFLIACHADLGGGVCHVLVSTAQTKVALDERDADRMCTKKNQRSCMHGRLDALVDKLSMQLRAGRLQGHFWTGASPAICKIAAQRAIQIANSDNSSKPLHIKRLQCQPYLCGLGNYLFFEIAMS